MIDRFKLYLAGRHHHHHGMATLGLVVSLPSLSSSAIVVFDFGLFAQSMSQRRRFGPIFSSLQLVFVAASHKNLRTCAKRTRNFCHGQIGKGLFAPGHFGEVLGHFGSATGEKAFSREIPGTPRRTRHSAKKQQKVTNRKRA